VVTFDGADYASLDQADVNSLGQTIGTSEGNLAKFGFSTGNTDIGLDYVLDDIAVSADPSAVPLYTLRVTDGDNGGLYTNSQQVVISANSTSRTFVAWVGDTQYVASAAANPATVTMPSSGTNGVNLSATYTDVILTVNRGSGSTTNIPGATVPIVATDVGPGITFKDWTGSGAAWVADTNAASTTVTLPAQDISVTARYFYDLTITNGSGSGAYSNTAVVAITASNFIGKTFLAWTGDTNVLASNTASTVVTMPTNPATLTATYDDILYNLVLTNATTSGGVYSYQSPVDIVASNAPSGMTFDVWTGDTGALSSNTASTTVIMPAADVTLTATYKDAAVILTATVLGGNGTISPTSASVVSGDSTNFVITANNYYRISTLTTNGGSAGVAFNNLSTNYIYTWNNVQAAGTVTVSFAKQTATNSAASGSNVPFEWLASYGLTNYEADVVLDQDGDGMKTWQEYIAGTIPTSAASLLKGSQATRNIVTWNSMTGRVYSVYWSTNLVKGFALKQDNITYPTNNATASYTNAAPDSRLNHYQIRVRFQ
jgi:hypothetical protein